MNFFFHVFNVFLRKKESGFTLIELIVVLGILAVLFSLISVNLTKIIPKANVNTTVDKIIADLRLQQQKSMLGETAGSGNAQIFGVHFDTNQYVLFTGSTYQSSSASNSAIPVDSSVQITSTFPNNTVLFTRGSGEIDNFSGTSNTVTIRDTVTNEQRTLTFNFLGSVIAVNN